MSDHLFLSPGNDKLKALARILGATYNQVLGLALPAGWSCPAANICKAKANRLTGTITKGPEAEFLCYAAKVEAYSPSARAAYWRNFDALKEAVRTNTVYDLLSRSLDARKKEVRVLRISPGGDMFHRRYYEGVRKVAEARPNLDIFGYTKQLEFVQHNIAERMPNLSLHYSFGGTHDKEWWLLWDGKFPTSFVVPRDDGYMKRGKLMSRTWGVPIICADHNVDEDYAQDFLFIKQGKPFALFVH